MKKLISSLSLFFLFSLSTNVLFAQEEIDDPYIWLEEVDSDKALDWVRAKNETTLNILKEYPEFQEIYEKNLEIYNSKDRIVYPNIVGNQIYNFWTDEKNERGLWRRTTFEKYMSDNPEWETVLDIDKLSEEENQKWVYKGASWLYPDYKRCLVYLSPGGGDAVEIREFDAEKKEFIKEGFFIPTAKTRISWKDINTLYVGTDFGEGSLTESGYARIAKEWKRGTPLSEAKTVFEGDVKDVSAGIYVMNTPERQFVVMYRGLTFFTRNTYFLENGKQIKLDIPDDASFGGIFKNQILVNLKSDWTVDAKTYKQGNLISIDYDNFLKGSKDYTVVIAPDETQSISGTSETKNLMLVNMLNNVRSELYAYTFEDGKWNHKKIDAPDFGNLYISATDEFSDRYFFGYQDFLTPSSLFYVSGPDTTPEKIKSLPEFFDGSKFEVNQNFAVSKDGTKIPYFIIYPKGMEFSGTNPTLLTGYGGFEISRRPFYSATVGNSWLERGGVYVLANIRGGGEFGPKWHKAGLKENRQRVYDDFIAVAEDIVNKKITSPEHLGISGGSNGGLLVGVMFTQRPDLFNAVVCAVPLLDMKRYNQLLAGASWMGEYGNPDIPEEWEYISKYSPYHNLYEGKEYPKVFFTTSTRDDRVHPAHARKMAKKMEDMGYDFYYYENIEGGHGGVSTNDQRAFRDGLIYSYLLKQLK